MTLKIGEILLSCRDTDASHLSVRHCELWLKKDGEGLKAHRRARREFDPTAAAAYDEEARNEIPVTSLQVVLTSNCPESDAKRDGSTPSIALRCRAMKGLIAEQHLLGAAL
jgi:hypothetical protein